MQGHSEVEGEPAPGAQPVGRFGECDACQIVQEADHRIANHLAMLAGFVRLKASDLARKPSDLNGDTVQLVLEAIASQIATVGRLHRALSRDGSPSADLGEHLHDITASLSALCTDVEIIEEFAVGCFVQPDQILPLTQIVSEVLVNAVKYAHPMDGRPTIRAHCAQDNSGEIQIEIADNGMGLPEGLDLKSDGGLGFHLIRAFAKQLQARIEFESGPAGLCFKLTLPPPRMRPRNGPA